MLEIISDIQDPLETSVRWEKEETQKNMWIKCLALTQDLLENTRKVQNFVNFTLALQSLNDPGIAGLLNSVILLSVQHPNTDIRNSAVKCLGLFCLLSLVCT